MDVDWGKENRVKGDISVAVTGANGYIGAYCVLELLEGGYSVVAVVRDPSNPNKTEFLKQAAKTLSCGDASARLSFRAGDLLKESSYTEAFKGCQGILHTAAVVEIFSSSDPYTSIVKPSVEGTRNVLAAVEANKSTIKKYVHLSSCAAIQSLEKPESHTFTEADWNEWSAIDNGDPYGFAKMSAEKLVWDTLKPTGLPTVALNPGVVIGPVLCKDHTKSSAVLVRQILYGNMSNNYNCTFVDVRDVAQAALLAFQTPEAAGKRFLLVGDAGAQNVMDLNDAAKEARPWVKGATAQYSGMFLNFMWAVGKIPIIGAKLGGLNEFTSSVFNRKIHFDNAQSKAVLNISYHSLKETCGAAIDSMQPFVKGVKYPQ